MAVVVVGASLLRHLGVGVEFLGILRVAETRTRRVEPASVSTWSGNVRRITGYIDTATGCTEEEGERTRNQK